MSALQFALKTQPLNPCIDFELDEEDVEQLLHHCNIHGPNIRSLDIHSALTKPQLAAVIKLLPNFDQLKRLELNCDHFDDHSLELLSTHLKKGSPRLRSLTITTHSLTTKTLKKFGNTLNEKLRLQSLSWRTNGLSAEHLSEFCRYIEKHLVLDSISLTDVQFDNLSMLDLVFALLRRNKMLNMLCLTGCTIPNEALKSLILAMPQLHGLGLHNTKIDDEAMMMLTKAVIASPKLHTLSLMGNKISDLGVDLLIGLINHSNHLSYLAIRGSKVEDEAILQNKIIDSLIGNLFLQGCFMGRAINENPLVQLLLIRNQRLRLHAKTNAERLDILQEYQQQEEFTPYLDVINRNLRPQITALEEIVREEQARTPSSPTYNICPIM